MQPRTVQATSRSRFIAYELALQAAGQVFRLVEKVKPSAANLADQARRAAASVPLNLAEGTGRSGRDRLHHYRIAHGSAREASACIELMASMGIIEQGRGTETLELLDQVKAVTWRLAHPRR